jgi:hypothetical protein
LYETNDVVNPFFRKDIEVRNLDDQSEADLKVCGEQESKQRDMSEYLKGVNESPHALH